VDAAPQDDHTASQASPGGGSVEWKAWVDDAWWRRVAALAWGACDHCRSVAVGHLKRGFRDKNEEALEMMGFQCA